MPLDELLKGVAIQDTFNRWAYAFRKSATAATLAAALYAPAQPLQTQYASYHTPAEEFYVHIPSWVHVERAPFQEFGSSLFGLAYTSTGKVRVRDDLQGDEYKEVLFHEVMHVLYPNCSEQQIRQMVLARMGPAAKIHTYVCKP